MSAAEKLNAYDIAVVGGGIVGLVFARLLSHAGADAGLKLTIAVIDPQPPTAVPDAAAQLRVSAIAPFAQDLLSQAGIWQQLADSESCPYRDMHVWYAEPDIDRSQTLRFSAAESGVPELGHIAVNHAVRRLAWEGLSDASAVELISSEPVALEPAETGWTLRLANTSECATRLLVAADGGRSWVRDALGMATQRTDHHQRAIVAELASALPHNFTARQRFLPGGPVALLPLANGNSSLVWSCPATEADELLATDPAEFEQRLLKVTSEVLGPLQSVSDRLSFPLVSAHAPHYVERRCALLGDAAHQVHPLAGQGLNLGLLDAAQLSAELVSHLKRNGADPGDRKVLRRYERARKGDNLITENVLAGLNQLFASDFAGVAGAGMALLDQAGPLKRLLARYAMGSARSGAVAARDAGQL